MKTKTIYLLGFILTLFITSCDKILELDPKQSIDSSIALQSKEGINILPKNWTGAKVIRFA